MNNLIEKEAQQTHLSQELIFEEDQSLPGMFLHSEKQKYYFRTVSACYWGWGVKKKKMLLLKSCTHSLVERSSLLWRGASDYFSCKNEDYTLLMVIIKTFSVSLV